MIEEERRGIKRRLYVQEEKENIQPRMIKPRSDEVIGRLYCYCGKGEDGELLCKHQISRTASAKCLVRYHKACLMKIRRRRFPASDKEWACDECLGDTGISRILCQASRS